MLNSNNAAIIAEYTQKQELYEEFASTLSKLFDSIIRDANENQPPLEKIKVHKLDSRGKSLISLQGKIARADKSYTRLESITDLAGIRITTYFAKDVDKVAQIVQDETELDEAHSIDKRKVLASDRFGYLSVHYVVTLSDSRRNLREWRRYKDLKAEIQIRSVLQDAWAEIEHDLGYKPHSYASVPDNVKRRFARIAGLLEMADDQFNEVHKELVKYTKQVSDKLPTKPGELAIDQITLDAYMQGSDLVKRLDQDVARQVGAQLVEFSDAGFLVEKFAAAGVTTIGQLDAQLQTHETQLRLFIQERFPQKNGYFMPVYIEHGACLLELAVFLIAEQSGVDGFRAWYGQRGFASEQLETITAEVMQAYEKAISVR